MDVQKTANELQYKLFDLRQAITGELVARGELEYQSSQATEWLADVVDRLTFAEDLCGILSVEYENILREADDAES